MRKAIQIFTLSLCLMGLSFSETYSQTTPTAKIDTIDATALQNGDIINVPVRAYALTNIGSMGLWISFNTANLTYVDVTSPNSLFKGNLTYNFDGTYIRLAWFNMGSSGINLSNTVLFNLQFTYKQGSSNLNFYLTKSSFGDFTTMKAIKTTFINSEVLNVPVAFSLTYPVNNDYVYPTPQFQWNASSGAKYYKLFIDGRLVKDSIATTSYQLTNAEALPKTTHSWYVVAYNRLGSIQSAETRSIRIKSFPKGFALISPQSGSYSGPCNVKFSWYSYLDSPYGLAGYEFYLSGYAPVTLAPSDTSYVFPESLPYGNKTWYVIAIDSMGNMQNSSTYNLNIQKENIYHLDGSVTYDNIYNTPLSNVKLVIKDSQNIKVDSTETDNTGYFIFNGLPNGSYSIYAQSDKAAGGIDPVDALLINKYFVKMIQVDDNLKLLAGDVNGDGGVKPSDALTIMKYFVKTKSSFDVGRWQFEKPSLTINCSDEDVDFKGICTGDFNGSYRP